MKKIDTVAGLIDFFNANQNPLGVLLTLKTEVKMRKTGNPFTQVFKIQTIASNLNENYGEVVNTVREFEGKTADFVPDDRKWGKNINKAIIEKDTGFYLSAIEIEKLSDVRYEDAKGRPVEYADIEPFISGGSSPKKQGTDIEVKYRTYKMSSIVSITAKDGSMVYHA